MINLPDSFFSAKGKKYIVVSLVLLLIVVFSSRSPISSQEVSYSSPTKLIRCESLVGSNSFESKGKDEVVISGLNFDKGGAYSLQLSLKVNPVIAGDEIIYPVNSWKTLKLNVLLTNGTGSSQVLSPFTKQNNSLEEIYRESFVSNSNWSQVKVTFDTGAEYQAVNVAVKLISSLSGRNNYVLDSSVENGVVTNSMENDSYKEIINDKVVAYPITGLDNLSGFNIKVKKLSDGGEGHLRFSLWQEDKKDMPLLSYEVLSGDLKPAQPENRPAVTSRFEALPDTLWYNIPIAFKLSKEMKYYLVIDSSGLNITSSRGTWLFSKEMVGNEMVNLGNLQAKITPSLGTIPLSVATTKPSIDRSSISKAYLTLGRSVSDWDMLTSLSNAANNILYDPDSSTILGRALSGVSYTYMVDLGRTPSRISLIAQQNCQYTARAQVFYSWNQQDWLPVNQEVTSKGYLYPELASQIDRPLSSKLFVRVEADPDKTELSPNRFFALSSLEINAEY